MKTVHVMAGIVGDQSGKILLARRPDHLHQGGRWEFPGGKLEVNESRFEGLRRELREEVGIEVGSARPLIIVEHAYPDLIVRLDVWLVQTWSGEAYGREGQEIDWVRQKGFGEREFPPADLPVFEALALPERYLITGDLDAGGESAFLSRLGRRLDATGIQLVQLRVKSCPREQLIKLGKEAVRIADARNARVLLNADPSCALEAGAAGIHLSSARLKEGIQGSLPDGFLIGASCHDENELRMARDAGANFAVLAPVQPTSSHPGAAHLGWERFRLLAEGANLPVYALGGVGSQDLEQAWNHGGQGVAAISAFWNG